MTEKHGHQFEEVDYSKHDCSYVDCWCDHIGCKACGVEENSEESERECLGGTDEEVDLARLMSVTYLIGWKAGSGKSTPIPETASKMMSLGHDGLNWQKFLPLAKDMLKSEDT